jgi:hypothetical protein
MILRMLPIASLELVRFTLKGQGKKFRIRYRGPHQYNRDTLKKDARNFTVYIDR